MEGGRALREIDGVVCALTAWLRPREVVATSELKIREGLMNAWPVISNGDFTLARLDHRSVSVASNETLLVCLCQKRKCANTLFFGLL